MTKISLNSNLPKSAADSSFNDYIGTSQLGTPIVDDITFPAGRFISLEGIEIEYQELILESVRYTVSRPKNIVRTAINGKNGTFKEYNNSGDFVIRGQAALTTQLQTFPFDQVFRFAKLEEVPEAVPVLSKILNVIFGIDDVIIADWKIDPGNAVGNVYVNFVLESDKETDLTDFIISEI